MNSTMGYSQEIGSLQYLHLPRRNNQPKIGIFSLKNFNKCPQFGQLLGGVNNGICRGNRYITTFKKLPMHAPNTNTKIAGGKCVSRDALRSNESMLG